MLPKSAENYWPATFWSTTGHKPASGFLLTSTIEPKNATSRFLKSKRYCAAAPGKNTPWQRAQRETMTTRPPRATTEAPKLTIIVPCYNEELRLGPSLDKIAAYVRASQRPTELIVVNDGSKDRTSQVAMSYADRIPNLRVVDNGLNRGKGYSVRHGI